jgi:hypothetical protein
MRVEKRPQGLSAHAIDGELKVRVLKGRMMPSLIGASGDVVAQCYSPFVFAHVLVINQSA